MNHKAVMDTLEDLHDLLHRIDEQIEEAEREAARMGIHPKMMRTTHGDYYMTPMYIAKAQTINSIILLETASG